MVRGVSRACSVEQVEKSFLGNEGEKEWNKKMPTPILKVTHNPIPTSLFCFSMLFVINA